MPKLQHISDSSSSNNDLLVNDSGDDTDVSSMVEPLQKMDKRSQLHTDTQNMESFTILCEIDNKYDDHSMNVVKMLKEDDDEDGMCVLEP